MSLEGLKMVFQMLIQTQIENPQNTIWPFNHQELVSISGFPNSFNLVLMNSDFLTAFFPLPTLQIVAQVTYFLLILF